MAYDIGPRIGVKGEAEFNQQIQRCNNTLKELGSELKTVSTEFDKNANSQEALTKKSQVMAQQLDTQKQKLELLKSQYDKQVQKLNELKDALEKAKTEFGENSKEASKAEAAYQKQEAVTSKLKVAINETQSNVNKLTGALKDNNAQLDKMKLEEKAKAFSDFGNKAQAAGEKLKGVSVAAGAALAAVSGVALKAASAADDLNTLSKQTGISTEELQKFQYASDVVDVSMDTIKGALGKMTGTLRTNERAFKDLGVAVYDSTGQMRSRYDIFTDTVDALSKMTDETERDMKSQELFGRSFQELNPLIADGTEALKALGKEAEDLDLVIDQETLDKANSLNDTIDTLKATFKAVVTKIGAELAPIFNDVLDGLKEKVAGVGNAISKFIGDNPGPAKFTLALTGITAAAAPTLIAVGKISDGIGEGIKAFSKFGDKIKAVTGIQGSFTEALGLSGGTIALIVAGITVLVEAFQHLWETNEEFRNKVTAIWDGVKSKFDAFGKSIVDRLNELGFDFKNITEVISAVWDKFCDLLAPVFEGAFNTIANVLEAVLDTLTGLLDIFIGLFTGDWDKFLKGIKEVFEAIWNGIKNFIENILNTIKGIFDTVLGWIGTSWEELWSDVKSFFENIWNGIVNFFKGILDSIVGVCEDIWNGIKSIFSDEASESKTWGRHIGENLASGMDSARDVVAGAASRLSQTVADYLGHSTPKKGPLKNDDTFMPDMMENFRKGIEDNQWKVTAAVETTAGNIEELINPTWKTSATHVYDSSAQFDIVVKTLLDGKVIAENTQRHITRSQAANAMFGG